jgi:putative membrane protein
VLLFFLSVGSPLDQIGERFLFSAHMVQHMVIVYVVAPLILAGLPGWSVDFVAKQPVIGPVLRFFTRPVVAGAVYVLSISFWHVPAAYDYALRTKIVHVSQHLTFLVTAILLWWPLFTRSKLLPTLPSAAQILYVFAIGGLQMPLVGLIVFSQETLYPTYEFAPRLTEFTPIQDQVLGGAIMGVGGMFITLGLITRAFYRWHMESRMDEPASPS